MEQHKEQAHEYVASTFETVRYSDSMVNKIDSMWAAVDAESNPAPENSALPILVTKSGSTW